MKRVLAYLTVLIINGSAVAQSDEEAIKQTINHFFDGMRKADGQLARNSFTASPVLQTIVKSKDGKTVVRTEHIDSLIVQIEKPRNVIYDERITFETIKIDGPLAFAWTPYRFYVSDQFSHCGVNSFQLIKSEGAWRIQYIIDTRRKEDCQ